MALTINENTNEFVLTLFDFSGGLNTRDVASALKETELSDVRNFIYRKRKALKIRPGRTRLNLNAWGTDPITSGGGFYAEDGTIREIVTAGSSIGYRNDTSSTITNIKTDFSTSGETFYHHQYMNHYFVGSATNGIWVYDNTSIWQLGYEIPASAPTAADAGAGVMGAGTYLYKVTYYYADGESDPCASYATVTISGSHQVALSDIPVSSDSRVTQRKIYRTEADGTTYNLLTTISNNTATTYADNVPDSGLGAEMDEDNDYTDIRNCKFSINHKGRMWYAGDSSNPSRLYYSKSLHPESNPSTYYWDIADGDGDEITGLAVNLGALVIFKKYSTWVITGDTPTGTSADMVLENLNPKIGCVSADTIDNAGNDLLFLSPSNGVQRLHRVILASSETMDSEALSDKISNTIDNLNKDYLYICHAQTYDNKYFLFVPYTTSTDCDICLVLDLDDMRPAEEGTIRWTIYDAQDLTNSWLYRNASGEQLHAGSNTTGNIFKLEDGTSDDGALIEAYATTGYFDMQSFLNKKIPRLLAVRGRASEDYEFTIRLFLLENDSTGDWVETQDTGSYAGGGVVGSDDIQYDMQLYDDVLYDSDAAYTSTVVDFIWTQYLDIPAYSIKVKIESVSANSEFLLYGYQLQGFVTLARPIENV